MKLGGNPFSKKNKAEKLCMVIQKGPENPFKSKYSKVLIFKLSQG
jgi:hypothetical protein